MEANWSGGSTDGVPRDMAKPDTLTVNSSKVKLSVAQIIRGVIIVAACTAAFLNLKHDIRAGQMRRWTEDDDRLYMREFGYLNPSIALPQHRRVTTTGESP